MRIKSAVCTIAASSKALYRNSDIDGVEAYGVTQGLITTGFAMEMQIYALHEPQCNDF